MIKALVLTVRYAVLSIRLSLTSNRAERFRMLGQFEKWCK